MARADLLDVRPGWGGGKLNAVSVSLEPLTDEQAGTLLASLDGVGRTPRRESSGVSRAPPRATRCSWRRSSAMLIDDGLIQWDGRHLRAREGSRHRHWNAQRDGAHCRTAQGHARRVDASPTRAHCTGRFLGLVVAIAVLMIVTIVVVEDLAASPRCSTCSSSEWRLDVRRCRRGSRAVVTDVLLDWRPAHGAAERDRKGSQQRSRRWGRPPSSHRTRQGRSPRTR